MLNWIVQIHFIEVCLLVCCLPCNVFKLLCSFPYRVTGAYVQTLRIIISRDIVRFMAVFIILLFLFSGALYLSLRYDDTLVTTLGSNTTSPNMTSPGGGVNSDLRNLDGEGRLLHEVYFTGLRVLIESGSVLNYYGPSGGLRYMHWKHVLSANEYF